MQQVPPSPLGGMEAQILEIELKEKLWKAIKTNNDNLPKDWFQRILGGTLEVLKNGRLYVPSSLDYAKKRNYISDEQCRAGTRLANDFAKASSLKGIDYTEFAISTSSSGVFITQRVVEATRLVQDALNADLGRMGREVLIAVCIEDKRLSEVEQEKGYPQQMARLVLREALDVLIGHYEQSGVRF